MQCRMPARGPQQAHRRVRGSGQARGSRSGPLWEKRAESASPAPPLGLPRPLSWVFSPFYPWKIPGDILGRADLGEPCMGQVPAVCQPDSQRWAPPTPSLQPGGHGAPPTSPLSGLATALCAQRDRRRCATTRPALRRRPPQWASVCPSPSTAAAAPAPGATSGRVQSQNVSIQGAVSSVRAPARAVGEGAASPCPPHARRPQPGPPGVRASACSGSLSGPLCHLPGQSSRRPRCGLPGDQVRGQTLTGPRTGRCARSCGRGPCRGGRAAGWARRRRR